ncbi:MAG TPA: type II toxin-antitoxin system RelE/ParE family toxin [Rhizomicrobium sp.]|nr:type II toxin-antitoxin system RelE/ParE family toxin [Rhizomicrobium sp.]
MIKTFKSKSLAELWSTGRTSKIDQKMQRRVLVRLDRLNVLASPAEMNVPGFDFHPLRGFDPTRHSVHVNGPWCITFEFANGDAYRIDFEQYHWVWRAR